MSLTLSKESLPHQKAPTDRLPKWVLYMTLCYKSQTKILKEGEESNYEFMLRQRRSLFQGRPSKVEDSVQLFSTVRLS